MRKLTLLLFLAGLLLVLGAPWVRASSALDLPKPGNIEDLSKTAEVKGDIARARKDYLMAAEYYRTALRTDKQNAMLYNKLGITELKLGDNRSARKHFSEAIKRDPKYADALNNLGALSCLEKKYKPASKYLKQALALDETRAATHINLAETWFGLGKVEWAMTEYARALELDPDILTPQSDGLIARVSTPEQRARINYLIAKAYAKRGNLDGALDYLSRAKEDHFNELAKVYEDEEFAVLWKDPRLAKIVKR
jgi:tetratricopeptide (TPR) repeat protein